MNRTISILLLALGLFIVLGILLPRVAASRLPGNHQGYSPEQPIPYSHRLHAGELGIDCLFCHFGAETSRHAGIPPVAVCMNCHKTVTAPIGEIRAEEKLAEAEGRKPRPLLSPGIALLHEAFEKGEPIRWMRVHHLPDFAFFDHRSHVTAGVSCQRCHGPVERMERMRQESDLSMGWCVNCHREVNETGVNGHAVNATLDCAACHY